MTYTCATLNIQIVMKRIFTISLALVLHLTSALATSPTVSDFDSFFKNETLRLDYIFAGDALSQAIFLDQMSVSDHWYGKRHRLDEVPMDGNGQVVMTDWQTGEVIFRNSFSTLFQEWLSTPEAKAVSRSFENVFLTPMPRRKARVTVSLRDSRHQTVAEMSHIVDPADILIRHKSTSPATPYRTLQAADDPERCIHIAFVAEGFTHEQMPHFLQKAREAQEAIFTYSPFKENRGAFNVVAVMSPSEESGPSEPARGQWRRTALGSHFDTFYSDRYLTTLQLKKLHDILDGAPYEHVIVLVNTPKYGGGGILNSYNLTMTDHPLFSEVLVHEFGHSFAGLADEYAYEGEDDDMYAPDVEPWERNITTKVDFASKWEGMMGTRCDDGVDTVGLYEGAGYKTHGVWRPTPSCRMRDNTCPTFCPVCKKAIEDVIMFYTKSATQHK